VALTGGRKGGNDEKEVEESISNIKKGM